MTFAQFKNAVLSVMLGAVVATTAYVLSTASYVGTSTSVILAPEVTEAGTRWLGETKDISIEVRYISSLTEKPAITIRKKQQWTKLAICMASGILIAYITYLFLMRKEPKKVITETPTAEKPIAVETTIEPTLEEPEKITPKPTVFPEPTRHDPL